MQSQSQDLAPVADLKPRGRNAPALRLADWQCAPRTLKLAQTFWESRMARRNSKFDAYDAAPDVDEAPPAVTACWLCSRPMGKTVVMHHPVPKSRGGRDVVPMHPICQHTLTTNFSNSELQRYGMDVEGLLVHPAVRKFVDWVAKKDPDFSATLTKKQR